MAPKVVSFDALHALCEQAGASGIRHRACRAINEKRRNQALASQVDAAAAELATQPRFAPVVDELRRAASLLRPRVDAPWPPLPSLAAPRHDSRGLR